MSMMGLGETTFGANVDSELQCEYGLSFPDDTMESMSLILRIFASVLLTFIRANYLSRMKHLRWMRVANPNSNSGCFHIRFCKLRIYWFIGTAPSTSKFEFRCLLRQSNPRPRW